MEGGLREPLFQLIAPLRVTEYKCVCTTPRLTTHLATTMPRNQLNAAHTDQCRMSNQTRLAGIPLTGPLLIPPQTQPQPIQPNPLQYNLEPHQQACVSSHFCLEHTRTIFCFCGSWRLFAAPRLCVLQLFSRAAHLEIWQLFLKYQANFKN